MSTPVHHQFSIVPGDTPTEVHIVCEQHDESRWHGPRRSLLILCSDALPQLLGTLQGHLSPGDAAASSRSDVGDVVSDL